VLATATGRVRWALSHIAVAVAGAALLLAAAGVATGLGYGLRTGSAGGAMTGAAMARLPSALALASVAFFFGLLPRAAVAGAWKAVGLAAAIAQFGQVLQLSHWVMDIPPFTHAPRLPGGTLSAAPLVWLCLIALALTMAGLAWPAPPRHRLSFGNKGASALHRLRVTL
jgi:ABC-2 type transport system permease protein